MKFEFLLVLRRVLANGGVTPSLNACFNTSWAVPWLACFLGSIQSQPGFTSLMLVKTILVDVVNSLVSPLQRGG